MGTLVTLPSSYQAPSGSSLPPLKVGDKVLSTVGSSHAEYVVAPLSKVAPIPEGVPGEEAVGLTTTAFTAIGLVEDSYKVKKGDWVLIRAASGGVGTILVQVGMMNLSDWIALIIACCACWSQCHWNSLFRIKG